MNRRTFVTSSLTAIAGTAVASHAGSSGLEAAATTGVDFDFTGLFAFLVGKKSNQLRVLLPDVMALGMKDHHAPMLLMPAEYYEPKPKDDKGNLLVPHSAPTIIRLAGKPMASWSLDGLKVWVGNAHRKFEDDDMNGAKFSFVDTNPGINPTPCPIDQDSSWAQLYWFAKLEDLLGGDYATHKKELDYDIGNLASMIRLTQGEGAGRAPLNQCEQKRKYQVAGGPDKTFAKQMHVVYPFATNTVLNLAFAALELEAPGYVGIKVGAGLTPVTIAHLPLTHKMKDHYKTFYALFGESGTGKKVTYKEHCEENLCAQKAEALKPGPHEEPNSPDPDCIPPSWTLDV
jgi:hypothetical protein